MKKLLVALSLAFMACASKPVVQPKDPLQVEEKTPVVQQQEETTEQFTMIEHKHKNWMLSLPSTFKVASETETDLAAKAEDGSMFQFISAPSKDTTKALAESVVVSFFIEKQWQPAAIKDGMIDRFPATAIFYKSEGAVLTICVFGTGSNSYGLMYAGVATKTRNDMFNKVAQSIKVSDADPKPVAPTPTPKPAKK